MHKTVPSVSIVIASYNSADYLRATIGSCLQQTCCPKEIILIDDGSTDTTPEICREFADHIDYLRVENGGVSAARNKGASLSTGEWLLFLDSDDILLPTAVEDLLATASSQVCGVVYGMVLQRMENALEPRINGFAYCAGPPPVPAQKNFRRSMIITPGSALVKRSLFESVGGFIPGYEPMEDRDLWTKCGLLESVSFCDKVVLDKTWRPGSAGSQDAKRIYRGLIAQKNLRDWGRGRQVDLSWISQNADLVCDALKEALHWKTHAILEPLLDICRTEGYLGFWYYRALFRLALLKLSGSNLQPPAWLAVKPQLS
jgi:glycosyltransferase involved in cell wall biosynthesis